MSPPDKTPYERFVEATKLVLSVTKKEVDQAMRKLRSKRRQRRERKSR